MDFLNPSAELALAEREASVCEFLITMRQLVRYLEPSHLEAISARAQQWYRERPEEDFWNFLQPALMPRDVLLVSKGLNILSQKMVPTLVDEILVRQEYFFATNSSTPTIIDAGANFGLATYYFKRLFNKAKVVAVEPAPELAEIFRSNIDRQGWQDVELIEAAIAAAPGIGVLSFSPQEDTASTLASGRFRINDEKIEVKLISLIEIIDDEVDMLKIDIEGSEAEALEAAAGHLHRVRNIVCECHTIGPGISTLLPVLQILDKAGYSCSVARSPWAEHRRRFQLLRHVYNPPSYTVFASRAKE